MTWVIAIGGSKGGTGKSTIAQGLAVEGARHDALVILADMDLVQQSSLKWGTRRRAAGIEPPIDARLLSASAGIGPLCRLCDLLVIDTPGQAGRETVNLANASDLLLLTTDTNVLELEPTIMLAQSLTAAGVAQDRLAIALNKVLDKRREADARAYLKAAGYEALQEVLTFNHSTHDIGNEGRAVSEIAEDAIAREAERFFEGIINAADRARDQAQTQKPEKSTQRGGRGR